MPEKKISKAKAKAKGGPKRPGASSFELGDEYERKVSADSAVTVRVLILA